MELSQVKEKKLGYAKLSRRGQVTIPKTVRVFLEASPGDYIEFYLKNNEIVVRKATFKRESFFSKR